MARTVAAIFAAVILAASLRWLTMGECAYSPDPANYAMAVSKFDVRLRQPHPPGVLWFILLARAFEPVAGDATRALVFADILGSAGCAALAYLLGLQAFRSRRAGAAAAVLTATSPLLWFYSSTGQSYVWESFNVLAIANLAWLAAKAGTPGEAAALGGALGLLGGFRPFDVAFFLPVLMLVALRSRRPLGAAAVGFPLLAAGVMAWLVPTALASGGWSAYFAACLRHGERVGMVGWKTPAVMLINLRNYAAWSVAGLGAATFAAVWLVALKRRALADAVGPWSGAGALWATAILPASAFYVLGHLGQPGYVLTVVPMLIAIWAGALDAALRPPRRAAVLALVAGASAAVNCAFFLLAAPVAPRPSAAESPPAWLARLAWSANRSALTFTWAEIRSNDALCREWQSYVRRHFSPEDTIIVTEVAPGRKIYDRQIIYELRQYTILGLMDSGHRHSWYRWGRRPRGGGRTIMVPREAKRLVWLVPNLPAGGGPAEWGLFIHRAILRGRERQMMALELPASRLPASYLGFRLTRAVDPGGMPGGR